MAFPEIEIIKRGKAGVPIVRKGTVGAYLTLEITPTKNAYTEVEFSAGDPMDVGFYADVLYHTPSGEGKDGFRAALAIEKYARLHFFLADEAADILLVTDAGEPLFIRLFGELVDLRMCATHVIYCTDPWDVQHTLTNIVRIADALKKRFGALGESEYSDVERIARAMGISVNVLLSCYAVVAALTSKEVPDEQDALQGQEVMAEAIVEGGDYDPFLDD